MKKESDEILENLISRATNILLENMENVPLHQLERIVEKCYLLYGNCNVTLTFIKNQYPCFKGMIEGINKEMKNKA